MISSKYLSTTMIKDASMTVQSPQMLLDQLAQYSMDSNSCLTSLRLSCVALAHHSHLQFTETGLLEEIKVSAGKLGDQGREDARINVAARLRANPAGGRNIFAHSAMLLCLLNRFTFE